MELSLMGSVGGREINARYQMRDVTVSRGIPVRGSMTLTLNFEELTFE